MESLKNSSNVAFDVKRILHKLQSETFAIQNDLDLSIQNLNEFITKMNHKTVEIDSKLEIIGTNLTKFENELNELPANSLNQFPELSNLQRGKENASKVHHIYMEEHKWNNFVAELNQLMDDAKYLEASISLKEMKSDMNLTKRKGELIQSVESKLKSIFLNENCINLTEEFVIVLQNLGFEQEFQELFYKVKSKEILEEWEIIRNYPVKQSILTIFKSLEKLDSKNENQFVSNCWDYLFSKIMLTLLPSFRKLLDKESENDSFLETIIVIYQASLQFSDRQSLGAFFEFFVPYQKDQPRLEERKFKNLQIENSFAIPKALKSLNIESILFSRIPFIIDYISSAMKRSHEFTFSFNGRSVFEKVAQLFENEVGVVADIFVKKCKNDKDIWVSLENYINIISLFEEYSNLIVKVEQIVENYKIDTANMIALKVLQKHFQLTEPNFSVMKKLIENVCLKFQKHGFNGILNQIIVDMNGYFKSTEAEALPSKIMKFSLSPSPLIIKIGEEMLNFPQRLENLIELPGFKSKYLDVLKNEDEPINSWISALCLMIMKELLDRIENATFSKAGLNQLEVDLDYISNIFGALQVSLIPQLELINLTWSMTIEDLEKLQPNTDCVKIKELCQKWKSIK